MIDLVGHYMGMRVIMDAKRSLVLVAGGDVMLGEHPLMVGRGLSSRLGRSDDLYPFEHVASYLQSADLAFANLESSLAGGLPGRSRSTRECLGPELGAALLKSAGFGFLSVANNHTQQHGSKVFLRSVELLEANGLRAVGLADPADPRACIPVDCEIRGVALRFLAYSLRPRQFFRTQPEYAEPTPESLLEDVRTGVSASRTVIVSLHWGDEFIGRPAPGQIDLGRCLVDAGATLVIGHHPHVLQPVERRGNGLIAYSLGNLVFDMVWEERLRRSALLRCRLGDGAVLDADLLPLIIDDDFSPRPASQEEAASTLARLDAATSVLRTVPDGIPAPETVAIYRAEAMQELRRHRMASHRYFARNLLRYDPLVLASILGKAALRRVGLRRD